MSAPTVEQSDARPTVVEQIARIEATHLGYEDHGIFTVWLTLDYGGAGQGAGGFALDEFDQSDRERHGTAGGMDFIIGVLRACGVDRWEKVKGRTVYALREDEFHGAVIGLRPLPFETGSEFWFRDAFASESESA